MWPGAPSEETPKIPAIRVLARIGHDLGNVLLRHLGDMISSMGASPTRATGAKSVTGS